MSSWRLLPLSLAALLAACGEAPKVQPPVMALSATSLAFSASLGGAAPAAQQVTISNGGGGTLGAPLPEIFYGSGSGWLADVTVTGGAAPYTLSVRPSLGALAAGTYVATVRLATVSATNSPQAVTVTLQVRPGMQVTRRITSWGEDGAGSTVAPGDVTAVALLQDDGAGGTIRTDLTESSSPGTWVAEAPTGPWWAQVAWADGRVGYYRGSGLTLDLGEDEGGRAGRTSPTAATFVVPNLNGLDPWDDNGITYDTLVFYAWGAQASGAIADGSPPDFPLFGGETSLDGTITGFAFDWMVYGGPLLAAADTLYVAQLREVAKRLSAQASVFYQRAVAWTSATGLAQVDGQELTVTPADMTSLIDVVNGSLALNWQRSAFEAALPPYAPTGAFSGHHVGVYATPAPLTATAPLGAAAMPLLSCTDPYLVAPDFNAGAVAYARFLPAAWQEYLLARYAKGVIRRAPGATSGLPEAQDLVYRYDAMTAAPATIQPLVGAPAGPTIDGLDALAGTGLAGIARTPTLAWLPPAAGTPTSYRVAIVKLTASGAATVGTHVAELVVDGATTSLQLPAGLLEGAASYVARLTARSSPTDAGQATPLRMGVPFGEGTLWTVPFTTVP